MLIYVVVQGYDEHGAPKGEIRSGPYTKLGWHDEARGALKGWLTDGTEELILWRGRGVWHGGVLGDRACAEVSEWYTELSSKDTP